MQTWDILDVEYACTEKWDRIFDIKRGKSAKKDSLLDVSNLFHLLQFTFFSFGDYFVNFKNIFLNFYSRFPNSWEKIKTMIHIF
jgi:hypothetical protein